MKKIEEQINKLIEEIEKCADDFEKIKNEYGVTYDRNIADDLFGELEIRLSKVEEVESDYDIDIAEAYESISDENELKKELEKIESNYLEEEKRTKKQIADLPYFLKGNDEYWYSYTVQTTELLFDTFKKLKEQAEFLISLVDEKKQPKLKKRVDAIEIEKIQAKRFISVIEFTEIYGKSAEWQRIRKNRINDRIPFIQEKRGANILYEVSELEPWLKRNL